MPTKATSMVRPCAHTATTLIILMRARRMAFMDRAGLQAEYLLAPDLGITGDGVMADTGAADSTDARVLATDEGMLAATPAVTSGVVTTAAPQSEAGAPITVAARSEAEVDFTVPAASTVEAAFMAEAMVVDTGNAQQS